MFTIAAKVPASRINGTAVRITGRSPPMAGYSLAKATLMRRIGMKRAGLPARPGRSAGAIRYGKSEVKPVI
jgi:hypothetical protein